MNLRVGQASCLFGTERLEAAVSRAGRFSPLTFVMSVCAIVPHLFAFYFRRNHF